LILNNIFNSLILLRKTLAFKAMLQPPCQRLISKQNLLLQGERRHLYRTLRKIPLRPLSDRPKACHTPVINAWSNAVRQQRSTLNNPHRDRSQDV